AVLKALPNSRFHSKRVWGTSECTQTTIVRRCRCRKTFRWTVARHHPGLYRIASSIKFFGQPMWLAQLNAVLWAEPCATDLVSCLSAPKICSARAMLLGLTQQRLVALGRTLARPGEVFGWDPVHPPGRCPGGARPREVKCARTKNPEGSRICCCFAR